jgi:hypothetical protein
MWCWSAPVKRPIQSVGAEPARAVSVGALPGRHAVVGTVVLTDDPGVRVQQVCVAQQPPAGAEHRRIGERPGPLGIEDPHQPQPGLPGRPAVLVGQREGRADVGQGAQLVEDCAIDRRTWHAFDRDDLTWVQTVLQESNPVPLAT